MPTRKLLRKKKARWGMSGAAVLLLGGGGVVAYEEYDDSDLVCCAPPPLHGIPRGPDGEIDIASQSVRTEVLADHDFSLHVRPGGGAADWRLADSGESDGVLRAKGEKTVKGTHYFTFRALRTGTARVVLAEADGDRTMTYPVEVKEGSHLGRVAEDPLPDQSGPREPDRSRTADGDFAGTLTMRAHEDVRVANRYDNQPGYTWQVVREPDASLVRLDGTVRSSGDPAAVRQDWYSFYARAEGTTTVKLFGCYRCEDGSKAESAESRKFSVTKTLTIKVR
ncbi:hypothetical protein ACFQVC_38500 [Streptomyces monticola]|uniref:Uncharacterized protein n=1 Tax=Streptomyces monticola TaxID=2666263 RepID=A0ABW2JXI1_9ACTN